MEKLTEKAEKFFKLSIISTIQMIEEKCNIKTTKFQDLNSKSYQELELYRNQILNIYNKNF